MKRDLKILEEEHYDLVVIGGGITGACLAHDAALRGVKVALIEKYDFGMATSSASSRLLHGGIRYLQKLQFGRVRESARERTAFQRIAPHITTTVPFLIPTLSGSLMKGRSALTAGMWLYRLICSGLNRRIVDRAKRVPFGRLSARRQVIGMAPLLDGIAGLTGGYTLYEVHMHSSERMTLAFIESAEANGAAVANHVAVEQLLLDGKTARGVRCRDMLSGRSFTVRARVIANAAGPFLPGINNSVDGLNLHKETTGFSKGVHLVTRQLEQKYAFALSSGKKTEGLVTRGGRHIFMIPWRGRTLIGTTNVPYQGELEEVAVTGRDITDFLDDINAILPAAALTPADVFYAFAGLYPLLSDEIKTDTYQGHGDYQVVDHAENGFSGIVSVLGAKYTTARAIAEQAMAVVAEKLGCERACRTAETPLAGGDIVDLPAFIAECLRRYPQLEAAVVLHLVRSYGTRIAEVVAWCEAQEGGIERLCANRETLVGEVSWAVENEMALTLDDFVVARSGLATIGHPGAVVLQQVAEMMGQRLGWDDEERQQQIAAVDSRFSCLARAAGAHSDSGRGRGE